MADAVGQAEVGEEGKGPAGMTCPVYSSNEIHQTWYTNFSQNLYYTFPPVNFCHKIFYPAELHPQGSCRLLWGQTLQALGEKH